MGEGGAANGGLSNNGMIWILAAKYQMWSGGTNIGCQIWSGGPILGGNKFAVTANFSGMIFSNTGYRPLNPD